MKRIACAVALPLALAAGLACAQSQRPVRILVPAAPGGPSDVQIRLLAPKMSEVLGQTLLVDNRASANGVLAAELGAKANPDGHTLAVGNSGTHAVNATLYLKLPYDPVRDFLPITLFSTTGMVLAANPQLPGSKLQDLIEHAKRNPGRTNIAIAGATGQLAGDSLWSRLGIQMNNVNYKGSAPSEMAVLGGESQLSLLTPLASAKHIEVGKMKAYGITSAKRHPLLPNVPTVAEQGVKGYAMEYWNGLFAPAKTPDKVVRAVNKAAIAALNTPEIKDRFNALGLVIVGNTPEQFAQIVKADVEKFRKTILESGIPRL
ncbi:MAG: Bug family tripartite tricarboxylate transporter substrate binding protein [Burkholderiales bacterium]